MTAELLLRPYLAHLLAYHAHSLLIADGGGVKE